jgi:hypothetical protein
MERGWLTGILLILGLTGLTWRLSPPNLYDAASYHMPRVMLMLENRGTGHVPAAYASVNFLPPGNEYIQLHFAALGGDDVLANGTQWFASGGAAAAVSLALELAGAAAGAQVLGALLVVTMPQGILGASSANNHWSTAFWLAAFLVFGLRFGREPSWPGALALALAAGLAANTKTTAYLFLPGAAAVFLPAWDRRAWLDAARRLPWMGLVFALLVAPNLVRNQRTWGNPLGPKPMSADQSFQITNARFTPPAVAANVLRNLMLQLETPVPGMDRQVEASVRRAIGWLGEDPDDRGFVWFDQRFHMPPNVNHETLRANALHMILYLALAAAMAWRPWRRRGPEARYWLGPALAAVLFCGLLQWQPWNTRLHLPVFVLAAVPAAIALWRLWPRWALGALTAALLALSWGPATGNSLRPLKGPNSVLTTPRRHLYYFDYAGSEPLYEQALREIGRRGCRKVGVEENRNHFSYPFFALLGVARGESEVRFTGVRNSSAAIRQDFDPCAVVCLSCLSDGPRLDRYRSRGWSVEPLGPHTLLWPPATPGVSKQ